MRSYATLARETYSVERGNGRERITSYSGHEAGAASKSGVPDLVLKKFGKLQTTKYSKRRYGAISRIAIRAQIAHKIFRFRSRSSSLYFHHASAGSAGLKRIDRLADQLIRVQVFSHGFVTYSSDVSGKRLCDSGKAKRLPLRSPQLRASFV